MVQEALPAWLFDLASLLATPGSSVGITAIARTLLNTQGAVESCCVGYCPARWPSCAVGGFTRDIPAASGRGSGHLHRSLPSVAVITGVNSRRGPPKATGKAAQVSRVGGGAVRSGLALQFGFE